MGQAAFLADYIFRRGRMGLFGTQGFKNYAVLNSVTLAPGAYLQTYARVANQYGVNFLVGTWGNAYLQGSLAYLRQHQGGPDKPGGTLKLVQPLSDYFAVTAEADLNETLLNSANSGRLAFGIEFGNSMHPKEFANIKTPVPMDVPRVRYEFGTRRVGSSPPIADAGPNQLGISAGMADWGCGSTVRWKGDPLLRRCRRWLRWALRSRRRDYGCGVRDSSRIYLNNSALEGISQRLLAQ